MIRFNFGFPEALLLYSFFIFNQSWSISMAALVMAVVGRVCTSMVNYGKKEENDLETLEA